MKKILFLVLMFTGTSTFAQSDNIFTDAEFDAQDFENASKDLAAAFVHTTNSGASSLGKVFGFEVGLVFGAAESKYLKAIAKEIADDPDNEDIDNFSWVPYAGLVGAFSMPYGLGVEASVIPKIDFEDDSYFKHLSGSVRWTITDIFPVIGSFSPLKLTAKVSYGQTDLYYKTNATSTSTETADFSISNFEYGLVAGANLVFLEPYVGVSSVKTQSELYAETDYVSPIPGVIINNREFKTDLKSARYLAGLLFKFPLFRFGLEYSNLHTVDRYTAKLAFKF